MRSTGIFLALSVAVLAACEPADTGGGGGVGGRIAFIRDGALVTSADDGSGEEIITGNNTSAEPAASPNGGRIAYAWNETGDENARSIKLYLASTRLTSLLDEPPAGTTYGSPTWGHDGETVYFTATTGAETRIVKKLWNGTELPAPVPGNHTDLFFPAEIDANTLLVAKGASLELNTLDLTTGELHGLGISSPGRAAVSPDGKKIAYVKADGTSHIVVRDLATGAETAVASTGFGDVKPAFSPDGLFVAFDAKGPNESRPKIYAARVDGTGNTVFLQSGSDVSWSQ